MPLIGSRLHVLNPQWRKKRRDTEQPEEPEIKKPFVVPETQEICDTSEELERKCTIYGEKIWTCRVTGKTNLTYKDAVKAELNAFRLLKKSFPKIFECTVLQLVHLNTLSIDPLVHACYTLMHEQFHIMEPVKLKVDSVSSTPIQGVIDSVVKLQEENNTTSPCNSDKENLSKKLSPMKKNYSYSVRISSDVPLIVHDIPANSIDRINKVPSKEIIRMFIRYHAMRYGPNYSGPWIVNSESLRRYKIPANTSNYQVDKAKLKQMSNALEEEFYARIMNARYQASLAGGTADDAAVVTPFTIKRQKRFSVLKEDNTSRKTIEDNLPLSSLKNRVLNTVLDENSKKKMRQSTLFQFGKKDMPQSNSIDNGDGGDQTNRPVKKPMNSIPRVAQQLIKMHNENPENPSIFGQITICAKFLNNPDLIKLPPDLRERVRAKKEVFELRKKMMKMSPNQRKEFQKELREKHRLERLNANKLIDDQRLVNFNSSNQVLPKPTMIHLPPGLTESLFGRLLGITEFLHCFHNLLIEGSVDDSDNDNHTDTVSNFIRSPVDSLVRGAGEPGYSDDDEINTDDEEEISLTEPGAPLPAASIKSLKHLGLVRLMKAVTNDFLSAGSYRSLARPLGIILRLLFKDEKLRKRCELGIKFGKLPVTPYTAPELLRLVLLHETLDIPHSSESDTNNATDNNGDNCTDNKQISFKDFEMNTINNLIEKMKNSDLHQLYPEIRVQVLEAAVERLFDLDLIDEHINSLQRRSADAWLKRMHVLRDRNLKKKDKKEAGLVNADDVQKKSDPKLQFDNNVEQAENEAEDDDLASIVKRRRVLAARASIAREEKENLDRQRRTALAEELAEEKTVSSVNQLYETCAAEAKYALRSQPLGYDRFHRRVWFFRCAPDCLFLESNWASSNLFYQVDLTKSGNSSINQLNALNSCDEAELTLPDPANLDEKNASALAHSWSSWSYLDRPEQLDQLVANLLQNGIRESHLRSQLLADGFIEAVKNRWCKNASKTESINRPIFSNTDSLNNENTTQTDEQKSDPKLIHRNAESALAGALLKNILDTEIRLRSGGLGGVPDFTDWQERLAIVQTSFGLSPESPLKNFIKPSTITTPDRKGLMNALLEVAEHVIPRFLNVPDLTSRTQNQNTISDKQSAADDKGVSHVVDNDNESSKGDDDEEDADEDEIEPAVLDPNGHEIRVRNWLSAWRSQVLEAHTLARLNLLHACLDTCIRWEKSVEDARCRICRRKTDDDHLLLCDGCNLAFHLYCLRPPLKRVPTGDWFCSTCRPASRALEKQRREERLLRSERRRKHSVSSDEEGTDQASDNECNSDSFVNSSYKRSQKSKANHGKHKQTPTTNQSITKFTTIKHDHVCLICSHSNNVSLLCSNCPNAFHLDCHEPPLRHVPRGTVWTCMSCKNNRKCSSNTHPSRQTRRSNFLRWCKKNDGSEDEPSESKARTTTGATVRPVRNSRLSMFPTAKSNTNDRALSSNKRSSSASTSSSSSDHDEISSSASDNNNHSHRGLSRSQQSTLAVHQTSMASNLSNSMGEQRSRGRPSKRPRQRLLVDDDDDDDSSSDVDHDSKTANAYCSQILDQISKHKHAWPFLKPVDPKQVPDYYEIITNPVDLSTIRKWLNSGRYDKENVVDGLKLLIDDLGTMFYNAELYNASDSDIWLAGEQFEKYVKTQIALLNLDITYRRPKLEDL